MFYTIYKIINKINNKFYIGMHKTININDGYMGSGKLIKAAIKKYGIENFIKEILYTFDNEEDMRNKEKELVVINEMSYNLCEGGKGGFGYINSLPNSKKHKQKANKIMVLKNPQILLKCAETTNNKIKLNPLIKEKRKNTLLSRYGSIGVKSFLNKSHTEETKIKMRKHKNVGNKNSQYGTCWITNGQENKKIKKEELDKFIELGYYKGRAVK